MSPAAIPLHRRLHHPPRCDIHGQSAEWFTPLFLTAIVLGMESAPKAWLAAPQLGEERLSIAILARSVG